MPRPPLSPISTAEQVRPAAPMSWIEITAPIGSTVAVYEAGRAGEDRKDALHEDMVPVEAECIGSPVADGQHESFIHHASNDGVHLRVRSPGEPSELVAGDRLVASRQHLENVGIHGRGDRPQRVLPVHITSI